MSEKPMKINVSPEGNVTVNLENIRYIGIENVADLKAYNMSRVGNRVMHLIEFEEGGSLEITLLFTTPNRAKIEVFTGKKLSIRRAGQDLIVGQLTNRIAGHLG